MNEELNAQGNAQDEDSGLVKNFQEGRNTLNAFDKLVIRYKDRVFHLCYRFLGDYEEANDAAQETFVKVYKSLKGFRLESSFSTWLYRIAVNTCKNKLSSVEYRYKKKTVSIDEPKHLEEGDCAIELKDPSPSTSEELENKEKGALIQNAIDSLPEEQRAVVVLRDIEALSYEEISRITGYNLGTVKSKLSRARIALQEKLKGIL